MKKINKTITALLLVCIIVIPASLSVNAAAVAFVSDYTQLETALAGKTSTIIILNDIGFDSTLPIDYDVTFASNAEVTLFQNSNSKRHFNVNGSTSINLVFQGITLDGNSIGGGFYSSTAQTYIEGVTIENCRQSSGAAIESSGWLGLKDCIINNNKASYYGGGIYCLQLNAEDCEFTNNMTYYGGGGAYIAHTGSLTNCTFTHNTTNEKGGAIFFSSDNPNTRPMLYLSECTITNNEAANGGGIYSNQYTMLLDTYIAFNSATANGGGLYMGMNSDYTSSNTYIYKNSPDDVFYSLY